MCLFCAAIPTALAVGAATHGKQREAARKAEADGQPVPPRRVPVAKATTALVVMLVVASAVYHTQQPA
ncbi:MAG: hypothetical protein ACT4QE_20755 [Anaerolineales bacterium]